MGMRIEARQARREELRRQFLAVMFGVVVPILLMLTAGILFIGTFRSH
jgi:Flp pilus assembly protein TadG